MKNTLKIIHDEKIIQMDRTFEKLARNARSDEYALLQSVRKDYPAYRVETRHIKKNAAMEHYKGLTYGFMREHILLSMASGDKRATLEEFEEQLWLSSCHSKKYSAIKHWFLEKYPEVKVYGVKKLDEVAVVKSLISFPTFKATSAAMENAGNQAIAD